MKIRPVGAELFHADGQTDMTKLIVAFRNFANAPNNSGPQSPTLLYINTNISSCRRRDQRQMIGGNEGNQTGRTGRENEMAAEHTSV
jgi:hypothetical protein